MSIDVLQRDFFQKQLHENQCSVEGLIDLKSVPISPYHNLQCEISDWTHRPCQVIVTDVERSFLDEGLGVGWEPSNVETHFGPITILSKKRECDQQKNVYKKAWRVMPKNWSSRRVCIRSNSNADQEKRRYMFAHATSSHCLKSIQMQTPDMQNFGKQPNLKSVSCHSHQTTKSICQESWNEILMDWFTSTLPWFDEKWSTMLQKSGINLPRCIFMASFITSDISISHEKWQGRQCSNHPLQSIRTYPGWLFSWSIDFGQCYRSV